MSRSPWPTYVDVCAKLLELLNQLRADRATRRPKKPRPSDALRALRAGSITVEEYLTIKLDLALQPLEQLLRPEHVAMVRLAMSDRIFSEPIWRHVADELRSALAREPAPKSAPRSSFDARS